ncbi:hypothetical protein [Candidatus Nitrosocosmicus arcticus]|uniref:Uncharacterized protein n=1 Tax=Candidatus Nitrosocosmicus arcticus TaxID=2035267 RepID=A0A557SXD3_9ARCH|nr:hypothetical protein [Candidatus Nitrosocosmicus arcticus]TVP41268.1 hypothetical protein NARC_40231 [Candidatus Nitrosocosmicus arcticus]
MFTIDSFVLLLTIVIDIAAISIILISMGQSLMVLPNRFLEVESKKFPTGFSVFQNRLKIRSDNGNRDSKFSSISILANGLLFALEFECANAVLKLIIVISNLFKDGSSLDIYNNIIFFVGILSLRMIASFTLRKIDLM